MKDKKKKVDPMPITRVIESRPQESKPKLVKCGKRFIDPNDVSAIKEAKKGLFVVKLRSEPNPEWPIWIEASEIDGLMSHFEVIE